MRRRRQGADGATHGGQPDRRGGPRPAAPDDRSGDDQRAGDPGGPGSQEGARGVLAHGGLCGGVGAAGQLHHPLPGEEEQGPQQEGE
eukprot:7130569-Pyramimonas_sp.AAC.1